jgi:hypothetical protein
MDTEWLVAWFYGRSQQVPPHVQERLKVVGFIDGVNLTDAGRRWLQSSRPHTVSKGRHPAGDGP